MTIFANESVNYFAIIIKAVKMPRGRRKKPGGARSVFDYLEEENVSKCKICEAKVPGQHLGNLKKHLKINHAEFYNEMDQNDELDEEIVLPAKRRKISVEYDTNEVEDAWLNLIVKEGRPFTILDSPSLRSLLTPIFGALEINMLTSHNVHLAIATRSEEVVAAITKTLANKIFSLKIDSATRHTRRVICINAQAVTKGKIQIFTLALCEMGIGSLAHTAKNIKAFVLTVLQKYALS